MKGLACVWLEPRCREHRTDARTTNPPSARCAGRGRRRGGAAALAPSAPALAARPAAPGTGSAAGPGSYVLTATSTDGNYAPTFTGNGYLGVRVPPTGQGYAGGSVPAESTLA